MRDLTKLDRTSKKYQAKTVHPGRSTVSWGTENPQPHQIHVLNPPLFNRSRAAELGLVRLPAESIATPIEPGGGSLSIGGSRPIDASGLPAAADLCAGFD